MIRCQELRRLDGRRGSFLSVWVLAGLVAVVGASDLRAAAEAAPAAAVSPNPGPAAAVSPGVAAGTTATPGTASPSPASPDTATPVTVTSGVWVAGDFHNHTYLTDGRHPPARVFERGLGEFGLSWMANSEHGGAFGRDAEGRYWNDPAIQPPPRILGDEKIDKNKRPYMWRWQSLCEYSFPIVAELRKRPEFADKLLLQGFEFNCPAHDHVSVGILADSGRPLAEFEYRFDAVDTDTSGGFDGKWRDKNTTNDHAKALQAIAWLAEHHPDTSWFIANHPERGGKVRIEDLRDFNNTAPRVAFGFEGSPGHQKYKSRGGYGDGSFQYADKQAGGATYGGVGVFAARVGGVWDALLGEGRRFFIFANSDFHSEQHDFFPGEYHKTYVEIAGPPTDRAVLDGMREGRSFFVTGDLIDALDFEAHADSRTVEMGGTLELSGGGADVTVTIRLHDSPGKNHLGDEVAIESLDLIAGEVNGAIPRFLEDGKTPNPAYSEELNPTARILAHFDESTWQTRSDGWITATYTLARPSRGMYLRLRGSNLPPGIAGETDEQGNPLSDALADQRGRDGLEEARADLWFYSNPIFIRVR